MDVLDSIFVTFPGSHLEMSALNAAADWNTTHHPNIENNNGHERRNDAKDNKHKGELKNNQKQISDTIH